MNVLQSMMCIQERVVKRACLEVKLMMLGMLEEQSRRDRYLKARRRVITCVRAAPRRAFLSYDASRSFPRSQACVPFLSIKLLL
jgi:hypothetical protein